MTDSIETTFAIHGITSLDTGDKWGIPDTPQPVGVLRSTLVSRNARVTMIVDFEHAEMLTTATDYLEGEIVDNADTIRWMRLGWPQDWGTYFEPDAWHRCVDGHVMDLWADV